MKIYCQWDPNVAEYEAPLKGYRPDIYVEKDGFLFNVFIYDLVRLRQDFESQVEVDGYFAIEPNVIIVPEVTREHIIKTIEGLNKSWQYFEHIKPVKLSEEERQSLFEF